MRMSGLVPLEHLPHQPNVTIGVGVSVFDNKGTVQMKIRCALLDRAAGTKSVRLDAILKWNAPVGCSKMTGYIVSFVANAHYHP